MLIYLLKTTVCWTGFYLVYFFMLRKMTFFRLNRWYLLGTALLGLLLPTLQIEWGTEVVAPAAYYLQPITIGVSQIETAISAAPADTGDFDPQKIAIWLYGLGAALALIRLVYGFYQLATLYRAGIKLPANGYHIVQTDVEHAPFSFFNLLFWSNHFPAGEEDRRSIIRHEEAHIFQWHSLDVLFFEFAGVACWFSPPIYFYKQAMKTTHEYLADAHVTRGCSKKQYGRLLLRQSHSGMQIALSNTLFSSQLKQRIVMMTKNTSSRLAVWNYLMALPVLGLLLLAFSFSAGGAGEMLPTQPESQGIATDSTPPHRVAVRGQAQQAEKTKLLVDIDEVPAMPGCASLSGEERSNCSNQKLFQYIGDNLKYPEAAKKAGVEGEVHLSFTITTDGAIVDAKILKGLGYGCDEELLRIINAMPRWSPARKAGKPAEVSYTLPVKFRLGDKSAAQIDHQPRFAGCAEAKDPDACSIERLSAYIVEHLDYPESARKAGLEGMVVVRFVVGDNGAVRDAVLEKGIGAGCDEAALRLVEKMPNWEPGTKGGKPAAMEFTLPLRFALPKEKAKSATTLLEAYPNPVAGNELYVKYKTDPGKLVIRLTDISGKLLKEVSVKDYDGAEAVTQLNNIFEKGAAKSSIIVSLFRDGKVIGTTTVVAL
jgi:TonB family protein